MSTREPWRHVLGPAGGSVGANLLAFSLTGRLPWWMGAAGIVLLLLTGLMLYHMFKDASDKDGPRQF